MLPLSRFRSCQLDLSFSSVECRLLCLWTLQLVGSESQHLVLCVLRKPSTKRDAQRYCIRHALSDQSPEAIEATWLFNQFSSASPHWKLHCVCEVFSDAWIATDSGQLYVWLDYQSVHFQRDLSFTHIPRCVTCQNSLSNLSGWLKVWLLQRPLTKERFWSKPCRRNLECRYVFSWQSIPMIYFRSLSPSETRFISKFVLASISYGASMTLATLMRSSGYTVSWTSQTLLQRPIRRWRKLYNSAWVQKCGTRYLRHAVLINLSGTQSKREVISKLWPFSDIQTVTYCTKLHSKWLDLCQYRVTSLVTLHCDECISALTYQCANANEKREFRCELYVRMHVTVQHNSLFVW